jgi:sacsin
VSSIGKNGDKDKFNDEKPSSSSKRSGKSTNTGESTNDSNNSTNGFENFKTYGQTSADSDSSGNATSESQSESESTQANEQDMIDKTELELTKTEIYNAVRQAYQLTGQERKKTVKKLLLKWHPDKNPGRERFAAEVFKHLRKQIDQFENDPLTSFFNTFNNFHHTPFSTSDPKFSWNKYSDTPKTNHHQTSSSSATTAGDERFGSFDNLNKDSTDDTKRSYQDIPNENSDTNETNKTRFSPHRSSSFRTAREEWQYRRQHGFQRRHGFFTPTEENTASTTNTTNTGTNSQPSSSTGGSKFFDFLFLFACSLHTHRTVVFFLICFFLSFILVSETIFGECSLLLVKCENIHCRKAYNRQELF